MVDGFKFTNTISVFLHYCDLDCCKKKVGGLWGNLNTKLGKAKFGIPTIGTSYTSCSGKAVFKCFICIRIVAFLLPVEQKKWKKELWFHS